MMTDEEEIEKQTEIQQLENVSKEEEGKNGITAAAFLEDPNPHHEKVVLPGEQEEELKSPDVEQATTLPKVDDDRMSKKQQLQKLDDEHDAFKLIEDVTISDEANIYTRCGKKLIYFHDFDRFSNTSTNSGYLNDELIEIQRLHILENLPPEKRDKVHSFATAFYGSRLENQNQDLDHWTKNIDLFAMDFIFFFINARRHWSLCVVVRPLEWLKDRYLSNEAQEDESSLKQSGCILLMDSLRGEKTRLHDPEVIGRNIKKFLSSVWQKDTRKNRLRASKPNNTHTSFAKYNEMEMSEYMDRIERTEKYQNDVIRNNDKCFFKDVPIIDCPHAPMQLTGFDCGIFAYKFFESVLTLFPSSFPRDIENSFGQWITKDLFTQDDVTSERYRYIRLLEISRLEYLAHLALPVDDERDDGGDVLYVMNNETKNTILSAAYVEKPAANKKQSVVQANEFSTYAIIFQVHNLIGEMHTFVDATIRFDSERSFSCNAGKVITFDSRKPSILLFYVPVASSTGSFVDIQVVTVDMEENRTELERIFALPDSISRIGSICATGSSNLAITTMSLSWEIFSKADQMFGCENDDPQLEWWFVHNEAISDIACAFLIFFQELGNPPQHLMNSTPSSLDVVESNSVVKYNGNLLELELTVSKFPKSQSTPIKTRGEVNVVTSQTKVQEEDRTGNHPPYTTFDIFNDYHGKKAPLILKTDNSTSSDGADHAFFSRPTSGRQKKKPTFLRDEVPSNKKSDIKKQASRVPKKEVIMLTKLDTTTATPKSTKKKRSSYKKSSESSSTKPKEDSSVTDYNHDYYGHDDIGIYQSNNQFPIDNDNFGMQNQQAPLKRLRSSNKSDGKTFQASSSSVVENNFLKPWPPSSLETDLNVPQDRLLNAAKTIIEETLSKSRALSDTLENRRNEDALKIQFSLEKVSEMHSKHLMEVADANTKAQAILLESLNEQKMQIDAMAEEHKRSKEALHELQLKNAEAEKKLAKADIENKWIEKTTKLQESNLILQTTLKSIKKGKKELSKSNAKEREIVMQIFKEGLSHTEKSNQSQNLLAKTCLASSTTSSQLQLLQHHSSSSNLAAVSSKKEKKEKDKSRKRRKKRSKEKKRMMRKMKEEEAQKLQDDIETAEKEAKAKEAEALLADNLYQMLLSKKQTAATTEAHKSKKRRSSSTSSSSESSSSSTTTSSSSQSSSS